MPENPPGENRPCHFCGHPASSHFGALRCGLCFSCERYVAPEPIDDLIKRGGINREIVSRPPEESRRPIILQYDRPFDGQPPIVVTTSYPVIVIDSRWTVIQ